jgi:integrase
LEDIMSEQTLVDVTGRLRSPAATPGHRAGCAQPNKGLRFPADPPTVEETILVMREADPGPYGDRTRGLIAILWRAGLRISEALALTESDLDPQTGRLGCCSRRRGDARPAPEANRDGQVSYRLPAPDGGVRRAAEPRT